MSRQKTTISPAQAIILLIDEHQKQGDAFDIQALKKLYLCGVVTEDDKKLYEDTKKDPRLGSYRVSEDCNVINNDPTRRYFETILAFETVKNQIPDLSMDDLGKAFDQLLGALEPRYSRKEYLRYQGSKVNTEMSVSLSRKDQLYRVLSEEDRLKYHYLFCIGHLPLRLALDNYDLPLGGVYQLAFFKGNSRGRISRETEGVESRTSTRLGILKSWMPAPADEACNYPEVRFDHETRDFSWFVSPIRRGPESTHPIYEADWPQKAFGAKFHPHVNSVSGTMLLQLRWLFQIRIDSPFWDKVKLEQFLRVLISAYLYMNGGHSYTNMR